ncbi:MAG: 16S rRNA (uracil(1498)-N(3))-methyltransferase [Clostridia bacterium]|nr:16S rRNA (uracil(1498)-N(3))-methyltransferase [Clostridia bacterium]
MYNFFVNDDCRQGDRYVITGADHNHIKNVLRMKVGDTILISANGKSNLCEIEIIDNDEIVAPIIEEDYQNTELPLQIHLFQGLPKSDKMELIIQKAVELGVYSITPIEMKRCIVKLDDKKKKSKQTRWQAISESAAKQSKRNTIPEINETVSYKAALNAAKELDLLLVPYENEDGILSTKEALAELKEAKSVGIIIGPEGGFDDAEIEAAKDAGGRIISLGKRILRTETAAITAVGMCMLYTEMNENE